MSIHVINGARVDRATATHLLKEKHDDDSEAIINELEKTRIEAKRKDQNDDSNSCVYPGFVIRRKS